MAAVAVAVIVAAAVVVVVVVAAYTSLLPKTSLEDFPLVVERDIQTAEIVCYHFVAVEMDMPNY